MLNRIHRVSAIKQLISEGEYECQTHLLEALHKAGYPVTQGTLSRDLHLMKAVKILNKDRVRVYALPAHQRYQRAAVQKPVPPTSSCLSIEFSQNLAVLRTRPGYAAGLASEIDALALSEVLGTVAGYDTVLLVMTEGVPNEQLAEALHPLISATPQ